MRLGVTVRNIKGGSFPDDALIIIEAYNRFNITRIELGAVGSYVEEKSTHDLPFAVPLRAKINYRLKVIDPDAYKILGYAENLKEDKYAKSLLELSSDDESVTNIFKIDFENIEHPVLYLNPRLVPCAEKLKPVIAEMALKEILTHVLLVEPPGDLDTHKWYRFAYTLVGKVSAGETDDEKLQWIQKVLCKFSRAHKIIPQLENEFND